MLKLKVLRCLGSAYLANARVDVVIYRPGVGNIDSATGYTNSVGYVEFSFSGLQNGDEARVTVTPSGESPDSDHTYGWSAPGEQGGHWDLTQEGGGQCADTWYDERNNIIQCVYD